MSEKYADAKETGRAMTTLARILLPKEDGMPQVLLYYRSDGGVILKDGALVVKNGAKVRFNTYFNGFFYPKYLRYTCVKTIYVSISFEGCFLARICCQCGRELTTISEVELNGLSGTTLPVCDLQELPQNGALFLELEARSPEALFLGGKFQAVEEPSNRVNMAAVICTYHREHYVQENLKKLRTELYADPRCPAANCIDVFVIDNGQTLPAIDHPHIQVIPNRNFGGSGGFARGILEAVSQKDRYTHVLFMDDDIAFEIESIVKTVQLLKYAREMDRPLCIGGQMLLEMDPTIQYESGGFYQRGRLQAVNRGLDVSAWENVLKNELGHNVQYNAWWYCAFPLEAIDRFGLPLPLFIKIDDVEYGLRMRPHVLLMDGIGVWHKAFEEKYSPYLEYYIKRNELVASALHQSGDGAVLGMRKLIRTTGKAILTGRPKTIDFLVRACVDNYFIGTKANISHLANEPRFKLYEQDLAELDELKKIFELERFEFVFHMAANSDIQASAQDPQVEYKNTYTTTFNILECMRLYGVKRLFFCSTSAVYGDAMGAEVDENYAPMRPISYYGACKLGVEGLISAFSYMNGFRSLVFRFPNVIGPRLTHGVIFDFVKKLRRDPTQLTILGDGTQRNLGPKNTG